MTIPANVVRVMMHSCQKPPSVGITIDTTGKLSDLTRVRTENAMALQWVCREVEQAHRSGQGEVGLFPWGWSYSPNQRTE